MLSRILTFSLEHRALVLAAAAVVAAGGIYSLSRLPFDAFPDVTPVQVQINTIAPALSPLEVEQQITFEVEQAIGGLPGLTDVRSISKFGLSQVTATFEDGTDVYFARQLVGERLATVELPDGLARPAMGPVATGLGEVFHYLVTSENGADLASVRAAQDWILKPRLRAVPGVAEVNSWGGAVRQYQILADPRKLAASGLTLSDLVAAVSENNGAVGGGQVVRAGEMHLVYGVGFVASIEEIERMVVAVREGLPVRVRDIGEVALGEEIRRGAVTANGEGEAVLGLGFMLMGQNSRQVTRALEKELREAAAGLPPGMRAEPVYERTRLVDHVLHTVRKNLFEGALLVIAVLFAFLGNVRAGLIVAAAIPLSLLFAFNLMLRAGVAGSLMSLGAIDFGLVVDSSVIVVENSVRRLGESAGRRPVREVVREAALEVRRPTLFGELIILIVYLPILTLEGMEGRLFRPMALTVMFALLGSLILSLTVIPVLASLGLRRGTRDREGILVRWAKRAYRPALRFALRRRAAVLAAAVAVLGATGFVAARLGSEFVPRLSEETVVINTVRLAGVSLEESVRYGTYLERDLLVAFPDEIADVWTRTGTPEVATDPMGIEVSDIFLTLTDRSKWKRARTQERLVARIQERLAGMPGMRTVFTQPIEMRVNEMVAGIRADVGVKIFGDDLEVLRGTAARVDSLLRAMSGSADVFTEQITGQPLVRVRIDPERASRRGVTTRAALDVVEAVGGRVVGEVREGQRRFDLAVRLPAEWRRDPAALRSLLVPGAGGERALLGELAEIEETEGPSTITREWAKRRIVVQCNVRGRDVGGFVEEARGRIAEDLPLPEGYHVAFGGQFEHMERARRRLAIVVPAALALIFGLLYLAHKSLRDALVVMTAVPFAAVGGVFALALRGMPFTIPAAIGFIALFGVAVLNGLVLVSAIRRLLEDGAPLAEAVAAAAESRLRPVLMTALVASLGFVPMAVSTGVGAEVQRPLATVVVGGVMSSMLLTLLVLPVLYAWAGRGRGHGAPDRLS